MKTIQEISDTVLYGYIKTLSYERKWRQKEFERVKIKYGDECYDVINEKCPYIKKQNPYDKYIYELIPLDRKNKMIKYLLQKVFTYKGSLRDGLDYYLTLYSPFLPLEEKTLIFESVLEPYMNYLKLQLSNRLGLPTDTFNSLKPNKMTLITSYIKFFETFPSIDEKIKSVLSKRIADIDVSLTVPSDAENKREQTIEGLCSENMITFCCPDYRYYFENQNYKCDTTVVGYEIGQFGEIVIKSLKKTLPDIYQLGKLKKLSILMPTYQIYLSPEEDYTVFCEKLESTGNKIKENIDAFCKDNNISIEVDIKLTNALYSDERMYTYKKEIQPQTEADAKVYGDFYKKTMEIETNYGNDKFLDILVSDIAEGDLLTEYFDKNNTLYLLPEDESMLRPQLIYMIQNKYSTEGNCRGLPTLILQST